MASVQDFVYSADIGALRKIVVRVSALLLISVIGIYYGVVQFNGLKYATAMDQSQLARQFATGQGYTTKMIRPLAVWQLGKNKGIQGRAVPVANFPDTVNAPAYPLLLAAAFKLVRPVFDVSGDALRAFTIYSPERLVLMLNLLLVVGASVFLYLWTRSMFDEEGALLALILFVLCDQVWQMSLSGMDFSWTFFLLTGLGWLVHETLRRDTLEESAMVAAGMYVGGAVLLGVLGLTRYAFLFLMLPYLGMGILVLRKKLIAVPAALVVWAVMLLPWLIRNMRVSGNPFGLAWVQMFADTPRVPGSILWRDFSPAGQDVFHYSQFARAFFYGIEGQVTSLSVLLGGGVLLALAFASILHRFRDYEVQVQRWFWAAAVGLSFLTGAVLFRNGSPQEIMETSLLMVFVPILCPFAAAFSMIMVERMGLHFWIFRYLALFAICAVHFIPISLRIAASNTANYAFPPYFPPVLILVKEWVEPQEVLATDMPWGTAWYENRTSLWIPKDKENFINFNDEIYPISFALFTPVSCDLAYGQNLLRGEYGGWKDVYLGWPMLAKILNKVRNREKVEEVDVFMMRTCLEAAIPLPESSTLPLDDRYLIFGKTARWNAKTKP
jgi:hypothetical protein